MVKADTPHAALIYLWVSEGTKALAMSSHALGRYASHSAEPGSQVAPDQLHHLYSTLAFNLTGFTFLLTRESIQTSQSYPLERNKGTQPSYYYIASLPQFLLVHFISKCNFCVAWHDMWCVLPTLTAAKLSSVRFHVFSQQVLFRIIEPCFTNRVNKNK